MKIRITTRSNDQTELVWLSTEFVLTLHDAIVDQTGGSHGVRDRNLLESAVQRPVNKWYYENATLFDLAAAYAKGICANHAFVDGNKRTAMAVAGMFLQYNCYDQQVDPNHEQVFVDLASNKLTEDQLSSWYQQHCSRNENCSPPGTLLG